MISTICFSLSALCLAALFTPRKSTKVKVEVERYTYYVGDDEPMPTWKRKHAPMGRVAQRVG